MPPVRGSGGFRLPGSINERPASSSRTPVRGGRPIVGAARTALLSGRCVLLALGALLANPAPAYHFTDPTQSPLYSRLSWSSAVWPRGGMLSVTLVDSPVWYEGRFGFDDLAELRRTVQRALDVWAEIPTADIRWEIGEVISPAELQARRRSGNPEEYGALTIAPAGAFDGGRPGTQRRSENPAVVQACDVYTPVPYPAVFRVVVHELGHCLGLAHAELFTEDGSESRRMAPDFPSYWRYDPIMSLGRWADPAGNVLTADDMSGASLLRPAAGFWETTGSLVGRVLLPDGTPANLAYVQATRLLEPEESSYSVGVFADAAGVFEIRGLAPGDYQLLVRSPSGVGNPWVFATRRFSQPGVPDPVVPLDLRQTLRAAPARVRAGEFTLLSLTVRRRGDPFR